MAPWIETVSEWFKGLGARVATFLSPVAAALKAATEENEGKIESDVWQFLENTADDAVKAADSIDGDWTVKLVAAVTKVLADVATAGLTLGKNEVVLLVVSAYTKLKASKTS